MAISSTFDCTINTGASAQPSVAAVPTSGKPRFPRDERFYTELKRRVAEHFERTGRSPRDNPRMFVKTAVLLAWFVASYVSLVFVATTWWLGALFSVSLALSMAGIGFGIQHDANHGAYSSRKSVNRLMGFTLDVLGASSYLWRAKHNLSHHTYTNLAGADDDINMGPLARLSPAQSRYRLHRVQHVYLWVLYGFLVPKWHFLDDFRMLARGRIAQNPFSRPLGWDLVELMGGKVLFFGWAFVVPALFHPFENVLLFYATTSFLIGLVLSVVFQLAHCVEEADFPVPQPEGYRLRRGWAVHQVQTTVDFAPRNRWLGWYVSGLNFQIEHHLFPRICHLHYPRLAEIVEATCAEFGVRYTAHQGLWGALSSHWRWLRRMGRPSPPAAVPNPGQRVPIAIKAIGAQDAPSVASVVLALDERPHAAPESVELLDGGRQTYPRMLHAVARAKKTVLLEVYSFAFVGIGARFVEALGHAAGRGVDVQVVLDGWGSARGGRAIAAALRESGCTVRIHNRLRVLFAGRFGRNHRKILIVDDEVAFLGGINIGDENLGNEARAGWADLALEIRGPQSERLGKLIRGEALRPIDSSLRLYICGPGGGWRLRQRYLSAFANARRQIHLAHGYFLPDLGVIRALTAASRRGVQVRLLLAGQSDVPLARAATRSVHRRLLAAGVNIHEWNGSVLHAKVAAVDGRLLLVGSFNLDPFSLANMETLVEVDDHTVVGQGEKWIEDHLGRSRAMTSVEASSRLRRWLLDPFGYGVAHVAAVVGRAIARESWPSKA